MNTINTLEENSFKIHFLENRLARISGDIMQRYWQDKVDLEGHYSRSKIIEKIIQNYQTRKSDDSFVNNFKDFFRDYVLTGKEADYLIDLPNPSEILSWIASWKEGEFEGQNNNFIYHTHLSLNPKFIQIEEDQEFSFPTLVIFLIGVKHRQRSVLNGLEVLPYHPTVEFEIIIRQNCRIVEIRGPHALAQDFVATAIMDSNNPLSAARNYFIGNVEDVKKVRSVGPVRQVINLERLKLMLKGSFTKLKGSYGGTIAKKFEVELEDMISIEDEEDVFAQAILGEISKEPIKGSISFMYNDNKYRFEITKTGGLFLRSYIPESVITYIIGKIELSSKGLNNDSNLSRELY